MKILAWDTSSTVGAIVLSEKLETGQLKLISEFTLSVDAAQHSEGLLWGIHQVLRSSKVSLKQIDHFAVGVGPGSFTGIRVGVTVARTLAHSLDRPLTPFSSMVALLRPWADSFGVMKKSPLLIAATDAAKGEFFVLTGLAKSVLDCVVPADGDRAGLWKRGVDEAVLSPDAFFSLMKKKYKFGTAQFPEWIAVGEAVQRYPDIFSELPKKKKLDVIDPFSGHVSGRAIAHLADQGIQAGLVRSALEVYPRYLREADAERKLKAGLLRKL